MEENDDMEGNARFAGENKVAETDVASEKHTEEGVQENDAMEGDSLGEESKGDKEDADNDLHYSECSFSGQEEEIDVDNVAMSRPNTDT